MIDQKNRVIDCLFEDRTQCVTNSLGDISLSVLAGSRADALERV